MVFNIVSWNVNGLRAVVKKLDGGKLLNLFKKYDADIICFQETKADSLQLIEDELLHIDGYESFWSFSKVKKGYSGVVTYAREGLVINAVAGIGNEKFDNEGRIIMTDIGSFVLFNVYFPNSGKGPERLKYKLEFYEAFQKKCEEMLESGRHIIICGDVNTAHTEIDIHNPKSKDKKTGFLPEERAWLDRIFDSHFVDGLRIFHKEANLYSWWDVKTNMKEVNKGWRIDYFILSKKFAEKEAVDCGIDSKQVGSDHAPIFLKLKDQSSPKPHPTPALSSKVLRKKQASIKSFFTKTKSNSNTIEESSKTESLKRTASSITQPDVVDSKKLKLEEEPNKNI